MAALRTPGLAANSTYWPPFKSKCLIVSSGYECLTCYSVTLTKTCFWWKFSWPGIIFNFLDDNFYTVYTVYRYSVTASEEYEELLLSFQIHFMEHLKGSKAQLILAVWYARLCMVATNKRKAGTYQTDKPRSDANVHRCLSLCSNTTTRKLSHNLSWSTGLAGNSF